MRFIKLDNNLINVDFIVCVTAAGGKTFVRMATDVHDGRRCISTDKSLDEVMRLIYNNGGKHDNNR